MIMVIMETLTLGGANQTKFEIKTQDAFEKKQVALSGKRDFSIITNEAIKIAEMLNASAIISFSEELSKIPTRIPLFTFTGRKSTMINELTRHIDEADRNIYDKIEERARAAVEDISDACIIGFINNLIETEGLVVGIMRMMDNDSIIVYDLSTNKIMKKLLECTERVEPGVLRSVLNIGLQIACQGREGKSLGTAFIIGDSNEVM